MQCKHFPKDHIGKKVLPSVCKLITTTSVLQKNLNLPFSAHASELKITKLEECYNLREINRQEEHPDPEIKDSKLKNVNTTLKIINKFYILYGLNTSE